MKLEIRSVTKRFGAQKALDEVSLEIADARCVAFIGPSGSGKSTLLRVIGGLEVIEGGSVSVDGEPLPTEENALREYRRRIGTVFQSYNLFPHLTALANLTLPLEKVHGLSPDAARETAESHLARFRLSEHAGKRPAEMSGGQRQRVAIARALSIKPRLMLFDEPTSALDPEMTAEVLDLIEELRHEGRDLIVVTHHMAFARRVADHVVFLADGHVRESAAAAALFDHPEQPETRAFLEKVLKY